MAQEYLPKKKSLKKENEIRMGNKGREGVYCFGYWAVVGSKGRSPAP